MLDITPQRYIPIFVLFCCALDLQSGANTAQVLVFGRNSTRVETRYIASLQRLSVSLFSYPSSIECGEASNAFGVQILIIKLEKFCYSGHTNT